MKLYSVALIARRVTDNEMEVRIEPTILIQETEEAAVQEAGQIITRALPPIDGWVDHKMIWLEIEQGMQFDSGQRLVWQIVEPEQNTEETNGPSERTES